MSTFRSGPGVPSQEGRGRTSPGSSKRSQGVSLQGGIVVTARIVNVVLGVWLFVSAFLWPHSPPQFTNTWVMGVLAVAFALIALGFPQARYLNTPLAVWLFDSVFVLPTENLDTLWNNLLVAVGLFVFSLVPGPRQAQMATARRPARETP